MKTWYMSITEHSRNHVLSSVGVFCCLWMHLKCTIHHWWCLLSLLYNITPLPVADITSLHPSFSFPLVGRGAETDSGEPLLWQLLSKWRAEGKPDVIYQWPPQSSRTRQKPIRWDSCYLFFDTEHRSMLLILYRRKCISVSTHEAMKTLISTSLNWADVSVKH